MTHSPRTLAALVGCLLAAACSSGANSSATTGSTTAGNIGGGDGGGAGSGNSGTTGSGLPYYGHVRFLTLSIASTPPSATRSVDVFFDGGSPFNPDNCQASGGSRFGSCCFFAAVPDGGTAVQPFPISAGSPLAVEVDGGAHANIRFSGSFGYIPPAAGHFGWDAGDQLYVSAPGGLVDAFRAEVTALSEIDYGANGPPFPQSGLYGLVVPIHQSLVITWVPAPDAPSTATMTLFISDNVGSQGTPATLSCVYADAAGTLTVPASALAGFTPGDTCTLNMTRSNPKYVMASNAVVEVSAPAVYQGFGSFQ